MYKIGLKLWSTNDFYIVEAKKLYEEKLYDYIELFVVPGSHKSFLSKWKKLSIPYIIHAPHSAVGLNLSKKDCFRKNIVLSDEAKRFADDLKSDMIIFHPGIDGDIKETVLQLNRIKDDRFVIENKPYHSSFDDSICVGYSPDQIDIIIKQTGVGFCLDIGHAVYAANSQHISPFFYLRQFISFSPKIYHVSDGNFYGTFDDHKHFGMGNFDLIKILELIQEKAFISIETEKSFKNSLKDFACDVWYIKNIISKCRYLQNG
jgi:sugar phosphate isomerase/epimerase